MEVASETKINKENDFNGIMIKACLFLICFCIFSLYIGGDLNEKNLKIAVIVPIFVTVFCIFFFKFVKLII